ncbi:HupE/UreJ family protein, partial [Parafrankia sp. FMc6]
MSTRLPDLGLPHDDLVSGVLAFNLGIELGQLLAIAGM